MLPTDVTIQPRVLKMTDISNYNKNAVNSLCGALREKFTEEQDLTDQQLIDSHDLHEQLQALSDYFNYVEKSQEKLDKALLNTV